MGLIPERADRERILALLAQWEQGMLSGGARKSEIEAAHAAAQREADQAGPPKGAANAV